LQSESVNGENAGRKSLPKGKGPDESVDAKASKDEAPAAADVSVDACSSKDEAPADVSAEGSLVILDKKASTAADLQQQAERFRTLQDAAMAVCRAKTERIRRLAASQQSPYAPNSTAKVIIPNKKTCPSYNPFAAINKNKLKELADWLKTDP